MLTSEPPQNHGAAETASAPTDLPLPVPEPSNPTQFAVLLFASLKDAAHADRVLVQVNETESGHITVACLLDCCARQHPSIAAWLPHVKVAVNCEYARSEDSVSPQDEIALLPPVSGGAFN